MKRFTSGPASVAIVWAVSIAIVWALVAWSAPQVDRHLNHLWALFPLR